MEQNLKDLFRKAIQEILETEELGFTEKTLSVTFPRTLFMSVLVSIKKERELSPQELSDLYREFPSILNEMRISIVGGREKILPHHWKPSRNMMRGAAKVDYRNRMILKYND